MVLIVVHGGIDPFSEPVSAETFGVDLPSEVSINVVDDGHQKEDDEVQGVYGNGEQEDDEDPYFEDGFQWMECVCGPGRGIGGSVMHQVKQFEQFRVMHGAVHPVEIGVVQDQHDRERHEEPCPPVIRYIRVECGVWSDIIIFQQEQGNQCKDQDGSDGEAYFPQVVFVFREFALDLPAGFLLPE
jgi:hypothetical protein